MRERRERAKRYIVRVGAGIVLQLVWMGDSLGDVVHVERGEGRWLRGCAVELVLAILDDRLEVFEAVFPGGQGLEELLLCGEMVRHGEGGREARGGLLGGDGDEKRGVGVLCEHGDDAFALVDVD